MSAPDDPRPPGLKDLTPEQYARYKKLSNISEAQAEAEVREVLAHPELWVSSEQILRDIDEVFKRKQQKPED